MTEDNVVITVDKDVPRKPAKRKRGVDMNDPRVKQLKALELDDSFFLADKTRKDVRHLVDLGKKIGVFLIVREVECDEIYQAKGARLWRVKEEEMPRYKPKAGAEQQPKPEPEMDDQGRWICDEVTYWHHAESACVGVCQPGEPFPDDGLVEPIDEETYNRLRAEYDDDL